MRRICGLVLCSLLAGWAVSGCMRASDHCGNHGGDRMCGALMSAQTPYCNLCAFENRGCVAEPVENPTCRGASGAATEVVDNTDSDADSLGSDGESTHPSTSASEAELETDSGEDPSETSSPGSDAGGDASTTLMSSSSESSTDLDESATEGDGSTSSGDESSDEKGTAEADPASESGDEDDEGPAVCGDNVREPGEPCDGEDLGGHSCESLGLSAGQLGCTDQCTIDASGCAVPPRCGDDQVNGPNETCDGSDYAGLVDCKDLGYGRGELQCREDCTLDTSQCCQAALDGCIRDDDCCSGRCNKLLSYCL